MVAEVTNRLPAPVTQGPSRSQSVARRAAAQDVAVVQGRQDPAVQGQTVSQVSSAQVAQATPGTTSQITEAVSNINNYVQNLSRKLEFSVDDKTDRVLVKVLDSNTEEVIREIPSKEALALAQFLIDQRESQSPLSGGLIIRAKA